MALRALSRAATAATELRVATTATQQRFASHVFDVENEFKGHKLDSLPPMTKEMDTDECWQLYKDMSVIRRMETVAGELYRKKHIRGFCHLYSGQEAVAVGLNSTLRDMDTIITAYRCHGWAYMQGYSVEQILAELFGRATGCSQGLGGSMHMYGERFFGGNGIVGAQVPVGAGVAFAHKFKEDGGVCFAFYGDGAANQGQVFEAYNMAKLWKLPIVFVCENNKFGMGTSSQRSSASVDYYTRGDYVPGIWVDGMDVVAVKNATQFAIEFANEEGPLVMEAETYRYHGHSMSDPDTTYRTRDDIKAVRTTRDPIVKLRQRMIDAEMATEEEFKAIDKEVRASVKAQADAALAAPEPDMSLLTKHILAEETVVRGCDPFTYH